MKSSASTDVSTTVHDGPSASRAAETPAPGAPEGLPPRRLIAVGMGFALAAMVALRFLTTSELWLDETLTVNIASRPVPELLAALRSDGHPPLFYLLLHGWMLIFGEGNFAVRALSGVFSVTSLVTIWFIARRLGGREVAWTATLLLGVSPFAVRYATETRMYSLLVLLTLLAILAYLRVIERPTIMRLIALGLLTGLLLLTHYWAFFLITVAGTIVLSTAVWGRHREQARRALVAMVLGSLLFVPWVPSFLHQMAHTGTPWGEPGRYTAIAAALGAFAGGTSSILTVGLGLGLGVLSALAVVGRPIDGTRIEVDLRGRPIGRQLAVLVLGTLTLAILVGQLVNSAYSSRYAAVVLGPFMLLAALGTTAVQGWRLRYAGVALAVVLGLAGSLPLITAQRTQAVEVAEILNARAEPGDVVIYCPDQLGPAHHRLLRDDLRQVTFPLADDPELVDWVDYADRNEGRSGGRFGREMDQRAGSSNVFVVSAPGYATFGAECERIAQRLATLRTTDRFPLLVPLRGQYYEQSQLFMYQPNPRGPVEGTGPL
jgi:mannosyltransferase